MEWKTELLCFLRIESSIQPGLHPWGSPPMCGVEGKSGGSIGAEMPWEWHHKSDTIQLMKPTPSKKNDLSWTIKGFVPPYSMPWTSTPLTKRPRLLQQKRPKKRNSETETSTSPRQAHHPRLFVFCLKISFPVTGFSQGPESHGALNTSTCASHPVQSAAPDVKADVTGTVVVSVYGQTVGSVSSERLTNRMRMSELWIWNEYHLYIPCI